MYCEFWWYLCRSSEAGKERPSVEGDVQLGSSQLEADQLVRVGAD